MLATALALALPAAADVEHRIAALEAEVRLLRHAAAETRAAALADLRHEIARDADARASLRDGDLLAGHDGRFFIASADGAWRLDLRGRLQTRFAVTARDLASGSGEDDLVSGFEQRRAKLFFVGSMLDGRVRPEISTAFAAGDGALGLDDAVVEIDLDDDGALVLRAGRFRTPFLREEAISSGQQLAAERSLAEKTLGFDRVTGLALGGVIDALEWAVSAMDPASTDFSTDGWRFSARGDLLLDGSARSRRDFTSLPGDEPVLSIGAGVASETIDAAGGGDDAFLRWTVDVTKEFGGANLFAALIGNHDRPESGPDRDQWALVAQGGVFVTDATELFARWTQGDADGAADDLRELTVGVNHYIRRHDLKLTADVGYGFDPVADFWTAGSANWLADDPGHDGQIVARAQIQLQF